jgi:hypothetical protein
MPSVLGKYKVVWPLVGEWVSTILEAMSKMTWCWVNQFIPRITSMPPNPKWIRLVKKVLLPSCKGTTLVIVLEGIFPPAVDPTKDYLVWQECNPNLHTRLSLMKLWVAPESNKILTGWSRIEKVLVSTAAPSGMSTMVVKLSLPCLTCTTGFLPWFP